jgi:hypothetical protein
MKRIVVGVIVSVLVGCGLVTLSPTAAQAATATWDAGGGDGLFSTATNWQGDVVPSDGDALVFPVGLQANLTNDLMSTATSIAFANTTGSYHLTGANLIIGAGGVAQSSTGAAFVDVDVTINTDTTAAVAGSGQLWFTGDVDLSGSTLSSSGGGLIAFTGTISGAGNTLDLAGSGDAYIGANAGATTGFSVVVAQDLEMSGTLGAAPFEVNGGSLAGEGTVGAVTTATNFGSISPGIASGFAPGILATGSWTDVSGLTFSVQLNGTTAGSGYDVADVAGSVNLSAMTLDVSLGFTPGVGDEFVIIDNDGADAVVSNFNGIADGASITVGGSNFRVDYDGGDGNDVVLTQIATNVTWDGGGGDDDWTTAANWVGDVAPSETDILVFDSTGVGTTNNDFPSGTIFSALQFEASGYELQGNDLSLVDGLTTSYSTGTVMIHPDIDLVDASTWSVAAGGVLEMHGDLGADGNDLELQIDGTVDFLDSLTANGATLDISGSGTVHFAADNGWVGTTNQNGATVIVDIDHSQGAWNLNGGSLQGNGALSGLTMAGGELVPGASPGALHLYNTTTLDAGDVRIEMEGDGAGEYDQLVIETGALVITGTVHLNVSVDESALTAGQEFTIIDNQAGVPISGAFADLPDDSTHDLPNDLEAFFDYDGGDGNDFVITVRVVGAPTTTTPPTTTPPSTTTPRTGLPSPTTDELPFTGSATGATAWFAFALLALGAGALAMSRRRKRCEV